MATWYKGERPSGAVLPLRLRRKLQEQQSELSEAGGQVPPDPCVLQHPGGSVVANRVFTAEELVDHIRRTAMAMVDIHKQLLRGEELYHEETNSHGNLFKGWDMFIDSKDVGNSSTGSSTAHPNSGSRRMPTTDRWFSGSCQSIFKTARITPLSTFKRTAPAMTTTTAAAAATSAALLKPPPPITIPTRPPPDPPAPAFTETNTKVDPDITKEVATAPTASSDELRQPPPQEIAATETLAPKDSPRLPADEAQAEQLPVIETSPDSNQSDEEKPAGTVPPVSFPPGTEDSTVEAMDGVVLEAPAERTQPEDSSKKPPADGSPNMETNPEPPPPDAPPQQPSSQGSKRKEKGKSQSANKRLKRKR